MTATIHALKPPVQLRCEGCGTLADAACDCGLPYVPASKRAEEAVAANPGKSDRAIAAEIGVSDMTVGRARKKSTATSVAVETRVGRDGKTRRVPRIESFSTDEFTEEDGVTPEMVEGANAANRRRYFLRCAADTIRKAEQGAGLRDARGAEINQEILRTFREVIKAWTDLYGEMKQRAKGDRK